MVRLHEKGYAISFIFGFGLTVPIRGGWRVDISKRGLREKSAKRSCISSSWPTASPRTDATKENSCTPAPPANGEDAITQRDYDLSIPSQKALPYDYEGDNNNDNKKDKKVVLRKFHPRPLLLPERKMIVRNRIATNPSIPQRRFPTTVNATTATTKITTKSREGTSWS